MSEVIEVRIDKLNQLVHFSKAYKEGSLQMNVSRIARELKCDRKTVRNRLHGKTPTKTRNKKKYLDEFRENMLNYLKDSNRHFEYMDHLYYFMKREHSITCCRTTLNRYIRNDSELSKAFKANEGASFTERFETSPGQQAQFDMKEKVQLVDENGNKHCIYIPTLTLSFSRHNSRKAILQPTTDNLLAYLAQTFEEIGGVPKELVIDNLKAFVEKPRKTLHDQALLNSKFSEFCKDYGITPKPCMPYRPQTKGKTETQNKIVDQLKNYSGTYTGILDIHNKLEMINQEDNERISQATRLPRVFLLQKEKGALLPLPTTEVRKKYHLSIKEVYVTNESLFQYKYNKYSLPKEFIGHCVGLAIQKEDLLVYYNKKIIEIHKIIDKKLNIKPEHKLVYETRKQEKPQEKIILNELENIVYDND